MMTSTASSTGYGIRTFPVTFTTLTTLNPVHPARLISDDEWRLTKLYALLLFHQANPCSMMDLTHPDRSAVQAPESRFNSDHSDSCYR